MIVFVAVDNRNGMMFNHRRQSQDKALRERVIELSKGKKLWMNQYSAKQFLQDKPLPTLQVDNMPLDRAQPEDFCFAEDLRLAPYERKIEKIVLFRWNRKYPADFFFDLDLRNGWLLESARDFAGRSHEKITEEVYKNENCEK